MPFGRQYRSQQKLYLKEGKEGAYNMILIKTTVMPYIVCYLASSILKQQRYYTMTLNVPVNNSGIPLAIPMEHFLLFRNNIEFQVKIDSLGKKELKGTVFLTSHRIIFVSAKPTADFWSFDIPIATLYGQDVAFPLFGNTYLKGSTPPNQNLLPGHCHFKLWFMNGGCDAFIHNLDRCIKEIRKYKCNMQMFTENSGMYSDMRNGQFRYQAFVDPNDPSQIFMEQPK